MDLLGTPPSRSGRPPFRKNLTQGAQSPIRADDLRLGCHIKIQKRDLMNFKWAIPHEG